MSPTARALIEVVLDQDSFESWDQPIEDRSASRNGSAQPDPAYRAQLVAAELRSGSDESVLTGRGLMHGRAVAVVVSEFGFLAGSIGRAAAARITHAVLRATAERLPVLASTASGGTRMQEGAPAFVEMIGI